MNAQFNLPKYWPEYEQDLRKLLPELRAGKIQAIEFGEPGRPLGLMSHHRIRLVPTPVMPQICFKLIHFGMESSGIYLGTNVTDEDIVERAIHHLQAYFAPTPTNRLRRPLRVEDHEGEMTYFAITEK